MTNWFSWLQNVLGWGKPKQPVVPVPAPVPNPPTPPAAPTTVAYYLTAPDQVRNFATTPHCPNIAVRAYAATVAPTPNIFNFAGIDAAIAALPAGALWSLSVSFGIHAPSWMRGQKTSFDFHSANYPMPVPWDAAFLADWQSIQTALAERYAKHPQLHHIVFGIQSISQETSLTPTGINWDALGYSKTVAENTWNFMIGHLQTVWGSVPLCMDFVPGAMPDGRPDEGIALMNLLPSGNIVQNNALQVGYVNTDILKVSQCSHAYQMVSPVGSSVVQAFQAAQANGSSYVEIYPMDVQYI